jgi:hypothetical protein
MPSAQLPCLDYRGFEAALRLIAELLDEVRRVHELAGERDRREVPGVDEHELGIPFVRKPDRDAYRLLRSRREVDWAQELLEGHARRYCNLVASHDRHVTSRKCAARAPSAAPAAGAAIQTWYDDARIPAGFVMPTSLS